MSSGVKDKIDTVEVNVHLIIVLMLIFEELTSYPL